MRVVTLVVISDICVVTSLIQQRKKVRFFVTKREIICKNLHVNNNNIKLEREGGR